MAWELNIDPRKLREEIKYDIETIITNIIGNKSIKSDMIRTHWSP